MWPMRESPPTPLRRPITPAEGSVVDPASFRDPSGFVFRRDGTLYRQVQPSAAADWDALRSTGLRDRLVADGLLIDHEEMPVTDAASPGAVAVIRPRLLDFISYPYEWAFSQLKEAALLTLEIQSRAVDAGMRLKDASAYNVQLDGGRPILIDSLSFEVAPATEPWPALPPVLRALPGAAGPDRVPRCTRRPDAPGLHRRHPARPGHASAAGPDAVELRAGVASARPRRSPAPRRHRRAGHRRRPPAIAPDQRDRPAGTARLAAADGGRAALEAVRTLGGVRDDDLVLGGGHGQQGDARARDARRSRRPQRLGPRRQYWRLQHDRHRGRVPRDRLGLRCRKRRGALASRAGRRRPPDPAARRRPRQPVTGDRLVASRSAPRSSTARTPTRCWRWHSSITSRSATTCRFPLSLRSSPGSRRTRSSSSSRRMTR